MGLYHRIKTLAIHTLRYITILFHFHFSIRKLIDKGLILCYIRVIIVRGVSSYGRISVYIIRTRRSSMAEHRFKFSIISAVYNAEKYLEDAIQSILTQDIGFEDSGV